MTACPDVTMQPLRQPADPTTNYNRVANTMLPKPSCKLHTQKRGSHATLSLLFLVRNVIIRDPLQAIQSSRWTFSRRCVTLLAPQGSLLRLTRIQNVSAKIGFTRCRAIPELNFVRRRSAPVDLADRLPCASVCAVQARRPSLPEARSFNLDISCARPASLRWYRGFPPAVRISNQCLRLKYSTCRSFMNGSFFGGGIAIRQTTSCFHIIPSRSLIPVHEGASPTSLPWRASNAA